MNTLIKLTEDRERLQKEGAAKRHQKEENDRIEDEQKVQTFVDALCKNKEAEVVALLNSSEILLAEDNIFMLYPTGETLDIIMCKILDGERNELWNQVVEFTQNHTKDLVKINYHGFFSHCSY